MSEPVPQQLRDLSEAVACELACLRILHYVNWVPDWVQEYFVAAV